MSECVIAIDHDEQQELAGLADKAEQLAELIHELDPIRGTKGR